MPFTDPMADGPAIQAAGLRALKAGQDMKKTLALVRDFRAGDDATPIVLMGYYNPIYVYGVERFLADAKSGRRRRAHRRRSAARGGCGVVPAGAQGRPQLHPPRHADDRRQAAAGGARQHLGLCLLRLDHRHYRLGRARPGKVAAAVARIKRHTRLPVCVGFGVRTAEQARAIAEGADGVVVGSALVDALAKSLSSEPRPHPQPSRRLPTWSARLPRASAARAASRPRAPADARVRRGLISTCGMTGDVEWLGMCR